MKKIILNENVLRKGTVNEKTVKRSGENGLEN